MTNTQHVYCVQNPILVNYQSITTYYMHSFIYKHVDIYLSIQPIIMIKKNKQIDVVKEFNILPSL